MEEWDLHICELTNICGIILLWQFSWKTGSVAYDLVVVDCIFDSDEMVLICEDG